MSPISRDGKVCYLEIPTDDVERSSAFYAAVFGWSSRTRGDGEVAFDDTVEVSGTWVTGRPPHDSTGLTVYVMVDDIETTMAKVEAEGGRIVTAVGADAPEITAKFADPYGNVFGLYQEPTAAGS